MTQIRKVAVLGSGVMGSGIAAHFANAGIPVLLLDIVPKDATNRNMLAEGAIEKCLKASPAPFAHKNCAKLVTAGNLEDDISKLAEVDWIVEVVLEDLGVKQATYKKIDAIRKDGCIVSSNTSTLPLQSLTEGLSERFQRDFVITHFFNPPRYMRLMEVTGGKNTNPEIVTQIEEFADKVLGKGVVRVKDTPGFIANRIGVYWLMVGLLEAIKQGIAVEDADAVMGKPIGVPKTGVFGLFDLIGIDLMPLIAKAMMATLPKDDRFRTMYGEPDLVKKMIADGYTGRKGKGGFFRLNTEGGKKSKEVINLITGDYAKEKKSTLASVEAAKDGLQAMLAVGDVGSIYAKKVLVHTLHYAASLIPQISDDIRSVDKAMRLGYNWKYGPFELIDRLDVAGQFSGAQWLAKMCAEEGLDVPEILTSAGDKPLYKEDEKAVYQWMMKGDYAPIITPKANWLIKDTTRGAKPVAKNGSARLWDLGDGVLGMEFTSKMNSIDPDILGMMHKSIDIVKGGFKGLVISSDADQFSVGANLGFFMYVGNLAAWPTLSGVIKQGQDTYMALKYAPFPVVGGSSGMALGGGCELLLHCDAVAAHLETYAGLVEAGVGVIPGWGGCKELLFRYFATQKALAAREDRNPNPLVAQASGSLREAGSAAQEQTIKTSPLIAGGPMPVISKVFEQIAMAKVSASALEAQEMLIVNSKSRIVMNRTRVLSEAKDLCLELAQNYAAPEPTTIRLPGESAKVALEMAIEGFTASGKATPHDAVVAHHLAVVLSGGNTDITEELTEQNLLDLEHDMFMELVKTKPTLDRIAFMLENNKPLRN